MLSRRVAENASIRDSSEAVLSGQAAAQPQYNNIERLMALC